MSEARNTGRRVKLLAYIEKLVAGMVAVGQLGNAGVHQDLRSQLAVAIAAAYRPFTGAGPDGYIFPL